MCPFNEHYYAKNNPKAKPFFPIGVDYRLHLIFYLFLFHQHILSKKNCVNTHFFDEFYFRSFRCRELNSRLFLFFVSF